MNFEKCTEKIKQYFTTTKNVCTKLIQFDIGFFLKVLLSVMNPKVMGITLLS